MNTQATKFPPAMMWITGIAIILFCIAGIAAIMGWIPTSMGHLSDGAPPLTNLEKTETSEKPQANAAKPAEIKPHSASQSRTEHVHAAKTHPAHMKCTECGVIESIREVDAKGEGTGLGAVGGAVVGGMLGNQVGGGHGKELATIVGAVGGVVAGNEIEKRVKSTKGYDVTIRLNDGSSRVMHEANMPGWRNGDHVRIVDGAIRSN
jgi:outer membrane lipoprotein SlyB